jgi:DNA-binding CsgD family transcriptional regulator
MGVHERFISRIYDCAANPELWTGTLTEIRDHFGAAYVMVGMTDITDLLRGGVPRTLMKHSPWDSQSLATVGAHIQTMPGFHSLFHKEIDESWMQMQECSEEEFRRTPFYERWVKPQKLRDCINVPFFRRPATAGLVTVASLDDRALFNPEEAELLTVLSPHLRRAMAISDMVDRGNLAMTLFRKVLDTLSTPIFIVGHGRRILFANEAGEAMLSEAKHVRKHADALQAARPGPSAQALEEAIDRAARGDAVIGLKGIGVPLVSTEGERAAAYVLPISGDDLRGALGEGYATVFIGLRGEQLPMTIEILRTVFDLTQSEARVAALIAKGDTPQIVTEALGVSINTVRTQLAGAFSKMGVASQSALAAAINALVPPVNL